MVVASAGPYANQLHLVPGRHLCQHHSIRLDALPDTQPTVAKHWCEIWHTGCLQIKTKKLQKPDVYTFGDRKKLLIVIHALRITSLGDHALVKLKVVAQNRWSLNEGAVTGTDIVTAVSLSLLSIKCKRQSADTIVITNWYWLSTERPIIGQWQLSEHL